MRLHRAPWFLRAYGLLPHRALGAVVRLGASARSPRWAVDAAIRLWVWRGGIDLTEFEPGPHATLQAFFLRRLRPGVRPLGQGFASPADGILVEEGEITPGTPLWMKGQRVKIDHLVNAGGGTVDLEPYQGGRYAVIFLTPDGYHHVHAPLDGTLLDARWIAGRFFPQNEDALRHVARIYERNERAVLRLGALERECLLVLVGASLVGGIHLEAAPRRRWIAPQAVRLDAPLRKGDAVGHFSLGSTVVVLLPRGLARGLCLAREGERVKMGQSLFTLQKT